MRRSRQWMLIGTLSLATGCQWIHTRSDFERDPLVSSHLNGKKDGGSAPTSSAVANAPKTTVARKPIGPGPSHAPDYRWIDGRLVYKHGRGEGWHLRYAPWYEKDRYNGEIRLAPHPRLGMVKEGDRVRVEGKVVSRPDGSVEYEATGLAFPDVNQ